MSELHMDVFLLNTPQPGIDQGTLRRKLAAAFKKDVATIDKMLGQPRTRIKKDVDQALANKYKKVIEAAGGQCELVSREIPPLEPSPQVSPTAQEAEESMFYCDSCGVPSPLQTCPECVTSQSPVAAENRFTASLPASVVAAIGTRGFYAGIFVISIIILAAIALPAYQDYTLRAKVQSGMPLVNSARDQLAKYIHKTNSLPKGNSDAGLPEAISSEVIASIIWQGTKLEVTFNLPSLGNQGKTIVWTPTRKGDEITWSCTGGTLPDSYRMQECRGGGATGLSGKNENKEPDLLSERMFSDDQRVSIDLPQGWRAHSSLSADASVSAAHVSGVTYALVIQESKSDFAESFSLSEYTQLIVSLMKENMKDGHTSGSPQKLQVKGLPAEQLILTGTVERIKVAYVLTTIESEHGFYQVLTWTLASRLTEQHALLRSIGKSFVIHQDIN